MNLIGSSTFFWLKNVRKREKNINNKLHAINLFIIPFARCGIKHFSILIFCLLFSRFRTFIKLRYIIIVDAIEKLLGYNRHRYEPHLTDFRIFTSMHFSI